MASQSKTESAIEARTAAERDPLQAGPRGVLRWIAGNALLGSLLIGAGLAVMGGAVVAAKVATASAARRKPISVESALEALDRGDFDAARQLAETLRDRGVMETDGHGYVAFVLGVLTLRETERANPAEKKGLLRSAAGYLEIAHVHGFPPGREAEGTWLFGKCLYEDGRFADARPVLREALELNPQKASETRLLLAGACLNQSPPRLAEALEENRLALADGGFPSAARVSAQLQRAEILLDLEKYSDCLAVLDAARSEQNGNAEAMLLRGQALLGEVRVMKNRAGHPATNEQIQKSCQAAVGLFRKAQDNQEPSSPTGAKAMYLVGVCLLEQGDLQGALRQFERTRLLHPSTPEALAANLRQAEILRQLHRDDESMAEYRRVLRSAGDGETYSNRWFPLEELRDRILDAYQHDLGDRKYERCLELVKHFCPVFPVERKILATAEAEQAWGRDLVNQAGEPPLSHGEAVLRRGASISGRQAAATPGWPRSALPRGSIPTIFGRAPRATWRDTTTAVPQRCCKSI